MSASFFEKVGVDALLGRTFVPEDDLPGAERVLVLSYGFWQNRLGGDPDTVGRTLSFEDARGRVSLTVAGVMPASFQFPLGTEIWVPARRQLAEIVRQAAIDPNELRGLGLFLVVGRLAEDVADEAARAEFESIVAALGEEHFGQPSGFHMTPLTDFIYGKVRTSLWLLSLAVGRLLLIACANVSELRFVAGTHAAEGGAACDKARARSRRLPQAGLREPCQRFEPARFTNEGGSPFAR